MLYAYTCMLIKLGIALQLLSSTKVFLTVLFLNPSRIMRERKKCAIISLAHNLAIAT